MKKRKNEQDIGRKEKEEGKRERKKERYRKKTTKGRKKGRKKERERERENKIGRKKLKEERKKERMEKGTTTFRNIFYSFYQWFKKMSIMFQPYSLPLYHALLGYPTLPNPQVSAKDLKTIF